MGWGESNQTSACLLRANSVGFAPPTDSTIAHGGRNRVSCGTALMPNQGAGPPGTGCAGWGLHRWLGMGSPTASFPTRTHPILSEKIIFISVSHRPFLRQRMTLQQQQQQQDIFSTQKSGFFSLSSPNTFPHHENCSSLLLLSES